MNCLLSVFAGCCLIVYCLLFLHVVIATSKKRLVGATNLPAPSEVTTGAGLPNTQDQPLLVGLVSEERSLVR